LTENRNTTIRSETKRLTLLLADTNSATSSASGLGMLTSNTQAPVVSQTTMGSDLLQALQILTQLALHAVCQHLSVFAVDNVALSVEEPVGDLVLCGILNDGDNSLEFFGCDLSSTVFNHQPLVQPISLVSTIPLVQINIGLLANQVGVAATDTLDPGQGIHDLLLSIDVGVEETEDELDCD
jgi:hypothetical protein